MGERKTCHFLRAKAKTDDFIKTLQEDCTDLDQRLALYEDELKIVDKALVAYESTLKDFKAKLEATEKKMEDKHAKYSELHDKYLHVISKAMLKVHTNLFHEYRVER